MTSLWSVAALVAIGYCIARGLADLRQKQYLWGVLGLVSAAVFLFTPVERQAHAIKVYLPAR